MMRRLVFWIPLIILSFLGGMWAYSLSEPKDEFVRSAMVGQKLPAFELPLYGAEGETLSQRDFADGRPRLLNLFGSWCPPCRAEAPYLDQLKEKGTEIHGVALRDKPDELKKFLENLGNPFAHIADDREGQMQLLLGSTGVPETYVISGKGVVTYQHIGDIREEHVPMLLQKLKDAE